MGNPAYQSQSSSAAKLSPTYAQRTPESGKVFGLIQRNWLKFTAEANQVEKPPAKHIVKEIEEFLGCGVLARGFLRLKCDTCNSSRFVAFSCKRRGFCPSCCGRRMNEGAAYLVDYVFPHVPIRQWVISFPIPVRFWMARNPKLITLSLGIFHRALVAHYRAAGKKMGISGQALTGAITVVQRFGSALNGNIHFHILALDGVYVPGPSGTLQFVETPRPAAEEVMSLIGTIQRRMLRALQRRGLVQKLEAENGGDAESEESLEALCQGASVQYRLAMGTPPGRPVRRIGSLGFIGEDPKPTGALSAIIGGYSLHAGTYVHQNDRAGLERMCRYLLRPPVAEDRLEVRSSPQPQGTDSVVYKLKSQWSDGTKAILLTGVEFVEKIVSIIPQPRIHGTRFHGVLAPHSAHRKLVVPAPEPVKQQIEVADSTKSRPTRHPRLKWAQLLSRVFGVDVTQCSCGGKLTVIAAIMDEDQIRRILDHMGLPSQVPKFWPA
jgi:hypothetical protein